MVTRGTAGVPITQGGIAILTGVRATAIIIGVRATDMGPHTVRDGTRVGDTSVMDLTLDSLERLVRAPFAHGRLLQGFLRRIWSRRRAWGRHCGVPDNREWQLRVRERR